MRGARHSCAQIPSNHFGINLPALARISLPQTQQEFSLTSLCFFLPFLLLLVTREEYLVPQDFYLFPAPLFPRIIPSSLLLTFHSPSATEATRPCPQPPLPSLRLCPETSLFHLCFKMQHGEVRQMRVIPALGVGGEWGEVRK